LEADLEGYEKKNSLFGAVLFLAPLPGPQTGAYSDSAGEAYNFSAVRREWFLLVNGIVIEI
jgi:hypothetical protein